MNIPVRRGVMALLVAGICMRATSAWPQPMVDDDFDRQAASMSTRDRKAMHWYSLRRTRGDTPTEQLEYADQQRKSGRLRRAGRAYNALVHRWHQEEEAVEAQRRLAHLHYERGRYQRAFDEFQYLIDHFAGRFPYDEAIIFQHRIIRHVMAERHWLGGRDASRALPLLEQVITNGPAHEDVAQARLQIGAIHEENRDYTDAIAAYEHVLQRHSGSPEAEEAAWLRAACLARLSDRTPRDEGVARAALSALAAFQNRYPDSPHVAEANSRHTAIRDRVASLRYEIAEFYDRRARQPDAALIAYRDYLQLFPEGEHRDVVEARIRALERGATQP